MEHQIMLLMASVVSVRPTAPGGVVSDDGSENGPVRTSVCVFGAPEASIESLRPYAQLFVRLMRRYKYLEKMFFEEIKKVRSYNLYSFF